MDDLNNQLKSQSLCSDMTPFIIELEGKGAVCLRGDSVYELTRIDGSKVQVTGLVTHNGMSFFQMPMDIIQNDDIFVEQPLLINIPNDNQIAQFTLDEESVAVPPDDIVPRKEFQQIEMYESDNVNIEMSQFPEFEHSSSILDPPEKTIAQSVIKKHSSCDVVCEVASNDLLSNLLVGSSDAKAVEDVVIDVQCDKANEEIMDDPLGDEMQEDPLLDTPVVIKRGRPKKEKEIEPPIKKGPFSCELCLAKIPTWPQFKAHKTIHAEENKPFVCKVCCLSFNVEKNLNLHMCLHNVGNLTCPECHKTFTRYASFKAHLPVHEEEENVFCSECGDEFTNNSQLEQHLEEHRNEWEKTLNSSKMESKNLFSCKSCNRIFTNPASFEHHKKDHQRLKSQLLALAPKRKRKRFRCSSGNRFNNECSICKKTFPKPSQLIRHVRIHTGEKPFKCTSCSAAFSQKGSLQIHMSKHNGYKPHVCSYCSLSFSQRGNLITHINKVHCIPKEGEEIYKCVKCPCSFKKLASLNCHVTRFHIGVKNPSNSELKMDTDLGDVDNLLNQIAELRNNLPASSEMDILQTAIRISGLPVSVKADESGKKDGDGNSTAEESNASEVRIVTIADKTNDGNVKHFTVKQRREGSVRWHQCNSCPKEFKKPSDLIRHIRIHTREKPFRCNQCFRTFSIKSTLKSHIRTHQSAKFYECKTCGKKVTSSRSLKIHQRSHVGVRPFLCMVCSKSFTTLGQLKTHYSTNAHKSKADSANNEVETPNSSYFFEEPFLIVGDGEFRQQLSRREKLISRSQNASSSERPFECDYCHLKFRKSSHLKQHKLQHTGEKPFSCVVCHKNFTTNGVLKMHLKTHLGQKDFGCDRCSSKFSTKGSLKRHVQTFHSEERPYMCPYCQKRFKTSVNCKKHIKIHRYDSNNQQIFGINLDEVYGNGAVEPNEGANEEVFQAETTEGGISQTLLADSTGTITLPALSQETLTQESIRELEQTLNQQLFGTNQDSSEYTVQMISSVDKDGFIDANLQPKSLILNVDETINEGSIVQTVFSQNDELQTVSNMSEILPEVKEPEFAVEMEEDDHNGEISNDSYKCCQCDKIFTSLRALKNHNKLQHAQKEHKCVFCNWTTCSKASLKRHIDVHHEDRQFSCTECMAKFRVEIYLKRHMKIHEGKDELRSAKRSKGPFREFSEAETELLASQDIRQNASVSEKILIASAAEKLRIDEKRKTENSLQDEELRTSYAHDCKYCTKSFKKPSDLTRHIRVHTGERPFQCSHCHKCFTVKSTLQSHVRTHFRSKPVSCHICQSMFAAKSSLKVHMRLHTGAKPFECQICGQKFRTSGHRKNHMISHTKNKPRPWKKQHLQMLNKIVVALADDCNVGRAEGKQDDLRDKEAIEELQEVFESDNADIQNAAANEALLLELNNHNSIVHLLSEQNDNEIVPNVENLSEQQEPVQFEIYTADGQVYITQQNPNLILCQDDESDVSSKPQNETFIDEPKNRIGISNLISDNKLLDKSNSVQKNSNECEFCTKKFSKKSLLERHLRIHTGERPFSCELCGKRFTQSNALEAHLKAHRGERSYSCQFCDFSCVQKGNLKIHMERTHPSGFFMEDDRKNGKSKTIKNHSGFLSDSLLTNPDKSPTCVRTSDLDQELFSDSQLFPQMT